MRALVIGFGKMGMLHAATLNSLPNVSEVIISESSPLLRDGISTFKSNLQVYETYEEAFRRHPIDLAVICTPSKTHIPIFKDLMKRNVNVFIEKPFAVDSLEAEDAGKLWKAQSEGKAMIGYCLRFVPSFEKAKQILEEGALGRILHFEAVMHSSDVESTEHGWRFEKGNAGGGVLLDLGSHLVDLVRSLLGSPEEVSGVTESWYSKHVEDYASATFRYPHFSGRVEVCWSMPHVRKPAAVIAVVGEKGSLYCTNERIEIDLKESFGGWASGRTVVDAQKFQRPVPFDLAGPFYTEQFMELLQSISTGKTNRNSVEESVVNHRIIDAIKKSNGSFVKLSKGPL